MPSSTSQESRAPAVIRLRVDRIDEIATARGLATDSARAEHIGVDRSTYSRIRNGEIIPGERFIAECLRAFPDLRFEDLFTVESEQVPA